MFAGCKRDICMCGNVEGLLYYICTVIMSFTLFVLANEIQLSIKCVCNVHMVRFRDTIFEIINIQ